MSTKYSKKKKNDENLSCLSCNVKIDGRWGNKCFTCSRTRQDRQEYWMGQGKRDHPITCDYCRECTVIAKARTICFLCFEDRKYSYDNR